MRKSSTARGRSVAESWDEPPKPINWGSVVGFSILGIFFALLTLIPWLRIPVAIVLGGHILGSLAGQVFSQPKEQVLFILAMATVFYFRHSLWSSLPLWVSCTQGVVYVGALLYQLLYVNRPKGDSEITSV